MEREPQSFNPYAMPSDAPPPGLSDPSQPHYSSQVQQIMPWGIVTMVNGALYSLLGLGLLILPVVLVATEEIDRDEAWILSAVYGVFGLGLLTCGLLQLFGGWRAIHFRSYGLSITAAVAAGLGVFTCYCAPTGLGVIVWGLILLLNSDVRYAYELRKSHSREEVLQHFAYRTQNWAQPGGQPGPEAGSGSGPSGYPGPPGNP
ncbi:hypothetical protein [Roseimaritima sediminicola]|uniref:hypothetical protein n=1 Tax=Roseimaritima sediminicola TaxID=2662066 RepID=UPI00129835D7|nr:hypothetical protein [Roseimaritima sediminicola]